MNELDRGGELQAAFAELIPVLCSQRRRAQIKSPLKNSLQLFTRSEWPIESKLPLMFSFFSPLPLPHWVRPPGGLGRGRGLDPLPEGSGLAPLQEHLPGVVRHRARGRPVQRRHHGPVGLRHPALRVRGRVVRGGGRA